MASQPQPTSTNFRPITYIETPDDQNNVDNEAPPSPSHRSDTPVYEMQQLTFETAQSNISTIQWQSKRIKELEQELRVHKKIVLEREKEIDKLKRFQFKETFSIAEDETAVFNALSEAQQKLDLFQKQCVIKVENLNNNITELHQRIDDLNVKIHEQNRLLGQRNAVIQTVTAEKEALQEKLQGLEKERNTLNESLQLAAAQANLYEKQIQNLEQINICGLFNKEAVKNKGIPPKTEVPERQVMELNPKKSEPDPDHKGD